MILAISTRNPSASSRTRPSQWICSSAPFRILLKVIYESIEVAGISIFKLNNSDMAVYVRLLTNDYPMMLTRGLGARLDQRRDCHLLSYRPQLDLVLLRPARAVHDRRYGVFRELRRASFSCSVSLRGREQLEYCLRHRLGAVTIGGLPACLSWRHREPMPFVR
jgi:hypothetical protein